MALQMDLQKLAYFTEGNTYTGSKTKDLAAGILLRYRVQPDKENGQLIAHYWKQDVCFELAQEKEEKTFLLNEEGLSALHGWLEEAYDTLD